MILVDSNIFMYAVGTDHPHKRPSAEWLERGITQQEELVLDAEVLQEILHRYWAIGREEQGRKVFDLAGRAVPIVLPIMGEDVEEARDLLEKSSELSARDALHAAIALNHGIEEICSYDRGFDSVDGITRIEPSD